MQLRKDRRDENLQKKRMVSAVAAEGGELESNRGGLPGTQRVRDATRARRRQRAHTRRQPQRARLLAFGVLAAQPARPHSS